MHESVLLQEVIGFLRPNRDDGTLVDATVGLGGHAAGLLTRYPRARLVAIDRDPKALEMARDRLRQFEKRVTFIQGRHEKLFDILKQSNVASASGILADLGVSSLQLDDPSRGFSFRHDRRSTCAGAGNERRDTRQHARGIGSANHPSRLRRRADGEADRIERSSKRATGDDNAARGSHPRRQARRSATRSATDCSGIAHRGQRGIDRPDQFVTDAVSAGKRAHRGHRISWLEDRIIKRIAAPEGERIRPPDLPVRQVESSVDSHTTTPGADC
jgi:hypothetical protein